MPGVLVQNDPFYFNRLVTWLSSRMFLSYLGRRHQHGQVHIDARVSNLNSDSVGGSGTVIRSAGDSGMVHVRVTAISGLLPGTESKCVFLVACTECSKRCVLLLHGLRTVIRMQKRTTFCRCVSAELGIENAEDEIVFLRTGF